MAKTELVEGVKCSAKVRNFPPMTVDEPPELGGTDAGMNPVELVLVALGTCQEIMYAACAALMNIPLNKVKVNVDGDIDIRGLLAMDDSIPAGYSKIGFETTIESDADKETLKKLVDTVEAHCPVMDTLVRSIPVNGTISIKKDGRKSKLR
ncbi:MAG: OsmC family protein [Deltaproteobacteria bacterium]|jgi:uncharacterized OsmC-like protein|nr:OsmC family protein [Deltaproteobacteria bacterium]